MRVLHVIGRMNVGGPAALLVALLDSPGMDVHALVGGVGVGEADYLELRAPAAEVIRVPGLGPAVRPTDDVRALYEIIRQMRRLRPDIVHTHTAKAGGARSGGGHGDRDPCPRPHLPRPSPPRLFLSGGDPEHRDGRASPGPRDRPAGGRRGHRPRRATGGRDRETRPIRGDPPRRGPVGTGAGAPRGPGHAGPGARRARGGLRGPAHQGEAAGPDDRCGPDAFRGDVHRGRRRPPPGRDQGGRTAQRPFPRLAGRHRERLRARPT